MALTDNTTGGRIILQGIAPAHITLADTAEVGDLLGYSSGWKRALATTGSAIHARLIAGQAGVSGDVIVAYAIAVVGGLTGMTAGSAVYAAEGTLSGEVTATQPSTTGDHNAPLGISLSATDWLAYPGVYPAYSDSDHKA